MASQVWDSRLIHWNASPTGKLVRFATYVCYCPRSLMTVDGLERKKEIFKQRKGTTHWPVSSWSLRCGFQILADVKQQQNVVPVDRPNSLLAVPRRPDGSVDPANRTRPFVEPEETPVVLKLVGIRTR